MSEERYGLIMRPYGIKFISAGNFTETEKCWIHPKRTAQTDELIYVTGGTLHICEDYSEYHVERGSVILLEKGHTHYGLMPSEKPLSFMRLIFSVEEDGEQDEPNMYPRKISLPGNRQRFDLLWRELIDCTRVPEYPSAVCDYLARLLLIELSVHGTDCDSTFNLQQRISDWIKNEAPSGIRVGDVADHFGYSEDHITRIFKNFYSKGLKNYIDAVRTCRIKEDLLGDRASSAEIAAKQGFANNDALHKFFKSNTGMSISTFRKLYM